MRLLLACLLPACLLACTEDAKPTAEGDVAVDAAVVDATVDAAVVDAVVDAVADAEVDAAAPDAAVTPPCADEDDLAPNQRPQAASPIEVGFTRGDLFICPQVTDHFALPLRAGERVRIELVAHPENVDLDLAVDDPAGMEIAFSSGEFGEETIRLVAPADGTYILRVQGYRGQTTSYGLAVKRGCRFDAACGEGEACDTLTELCAPFVRGACGGDEASDTHEDALPLPRQAAMGTLCPADRDWYAIDMEVGETLDVSVSFTAGRNLDVLVLGPEGRLVDAALSDANPERVVLSSVPAGRYLIGLVMPGSGDDAVVDYTLTSVSSSEACRIHRDCRSLGLPICSDAGTCLPAAENGRAKLGGPCGRGSDCAPGADYCFQGDPGGHDNVCTRDCETADDCADLGAGTLCVRRFGAFLCMRPCASDDDCSLTRRCEEGACNRRGRCTNNNDCGPGEACLDSEIGPACTLVED